LIDTAVVTAFGIKLLLPYRPPFILGHDLAERSSQSARA
jgi:hypothetical protein